jgi:hypothetical protein
MMPPKLIQRNLTYGCDPEMFVIERTRSAMGAACDKVIPAWTFLGNKHASNPYWDGFQAAWSYDTGFDTIPDLIAGLKVMLAALALRARAHNPQATLTIYDSVSLGANDLADAPPECLELGCKPSMNAYGTDAIKVKDPATFPWRFAGGHMHFGFKKRPDTVKVVHILDEILGLWSVGAATNLFTNTRRRKYYGLAGEYRTPRYGKNSWGIEYRTLSNFWLCDPRIAKAALEVATLAINLAHSKMLKFWRRGFDSTATWINKNRVEEARDVLLNVNGPFFAELLAETSCPNLITNVARHGIETVIGDPDDVIGNWGLA